jgi:hypothetical protein
MIARPSPPDRDPESPQPSARRHWRWHLECYIGKLEAKGLIQRQGDDPVVVAVVVAVTVVVATVVAAVSGGANRRGSECRGSNGCSLDRPCGT